MCKPGDTAPKTRGPKKDGSQWQRVIRSTATSNNHRAKRLLFDERDGKEYKEDKNKRKAHQQAHQQKVLARKRVQRPVCQNAKCTDEETQRKGKRENGGTMAKKNVSQTAGLLQTVHVKTKKKAELWVEWKILPDRAEEEAVVTSLGTKHWGARGSTSRGKT